MNKPVKDKTASVKAKLMNISIAEKVDFDVLLLRYFQERFLFRLMLSEFSGNFILKGGLLLYFLRVHWSRPTKDVDFLARGVRNTVREIENIFRNIAGLSSNDGVYFDSSTISSERIIEDTDYEGVRLKITAGLGKAKKILKFDIGFGDAVWPEPGIIEFPALLEEERPKIKAYSIESVIAEKFEIMVKLEMINSRMKDFYDIYNLSCTHNFDGRTLKKAIESTLTIRQTVISKMPYVFREAFYSHSEKQGQWAAFLRKTRIDQTPRDFSVIVNRIIDFLRPVVISIKEKNEMEQSWAMEAGRWI